LCLADYGWKNSQNMANNSPIVGVKGVTYGLQKPVKSNLFSADDGATTVKEMIQKEQVNNKKLRKAQQVLSQVLAQDPTAFAYDEVYEEMKKSQLQADPADKKKKREPKYIKHLLEQALEREKDDNIVYQRKLQKELEEEEKLYGKEREKFVTQGYKKQLELNKQHEEEQKKQEEKEKAHTAERAGMNSFYLNMLDSKNVALGGNTQTGDQKTDVEKGLKRTREEVEEEDEEERERERKRRLRERSQRDNDRAEQLRMQREAEREQRIQELQKEYSKHTVSEDEKNAAKQRFLERQRAKKEAQQKQQNLNQNVTV